MGSLAKGFLRKVCGNSAESSRKLRFIAPGKGAEILRKFRGNLRKMFCNDPFPNDPISELLIIDVHAGGSQLKKGQGIIPLMWLEDFALFRKCGLLS